MALNERIAELEATIERLTKALEHIEGLDRKFTRSVGLVLAQDIARSALEESL
jgi:chaperonin cofactor prefoldin